MKAAVVDLNFDFEDRFNNMDPTYEIGYDPDLAQELADSSGLTGQSITIVTDGSAQSIKTAEIVKNMLDQIGVTLNINNYDAATVMTMIYDPEADYDLSIGTGISPNRVVGDQLLNGVIWSSTLTAPDAFEGNEEYIQEVPATMSTTDPAALSEVLYKLLGVYEREVIHFALCNNEQSNAYADFIDVNSIQYSVGTGMPRFRDLDFVS
jgi:ABC-type transport system substrate-binding protein